MSEWVICEKNVIEGLQPICETKYFFRYDKGDKFIDDKILVDDKQLFILLDGVIFNKLDLIKISEKCTWQEIVIYMYKQNGVEFIKQLRGSFNGVIIDKKRNRVYSFVDQLGERSVFYYLKEEIIVTSSFGVLINFLQKEKKKYLVDKEAIKKFLYFGYMVDNSTYISEIKRLFPGDYIVYKENIFKEYEYYRFSNKEKLNLSNDEYIELIDRKFVRALKLQLDKDDEYGYEHLLDISGGLDARAVCFAAKKLGYKNITNICYSQMNAYEKNITEDLVRELGNDYLFKALDNASFIYSVDDIVKENYGLCYFAGITGGRDFLKTLNPKMYGIEHTGLLGDVYEGSFSMKAIYENPHIEERYRISKLLNIDIDMSFLENYSENEIFLFYTRGLLAGMSTHMIRQNYFETYSPFADVDFLELMFAIPLDVRMNQQIYLRWLSEKYPEAIKIKYAKTMCKIDSTNLKRKMRVLWNVLLLKIILPIQKKICYESEWNYKGTMNPMDYWYEKLPEIKEFVDGYYDENISLVQDTEIQKYLQILFEDGNMTEKELVMTVLSVYKQYLCER